MILGILETGKVPEFLAEPYGHYPDIFGRLYRGVDPHLEVRGFEVVNGAFPDDPRACDAWLITGSKYGVYDDEPWIEPLKDLLRAIRKTGAPMIGICFGHQIMAEAFGGRAEKSDKGWGCGVHNYDVEQRPGWMADAGATIPMHAMHQDQVTAIPPDAARLATSPFCEYAMLAYGDPDLPDAISIQAHPEFVAPFGKALVDYRKGELIPDPTADAALETFGQPVANEAFARWSLDYVRRKLGQKAAA